MTTASGAFQIIRALFEANKPAGIVSLRWQNEDGGPLADTPEIFAYSEFLTDPAAVAGFGGGRGANLYRNPARLDIYVFVPSGTGLLLATNLAEKCAAIFRSYRDASISCFDASVFPGGSGADMNPPGLNSEVGNYFWSGVEVNFFYDQTG